MDERSFQWKHFFPPSTRYSLLGSPDGIEDALTSSTDDVNQPEVLVVWETSETQLPPLERYEGLAFINPNGASVKGLLSSGFRKLSRYAVVPSLEDARWFVPLNNRRAAAGAFSLYSPFRSKARLKTTIVRQLARNNIPGWYGDEILLASRTDSQLTKSAQSLLGLNQAYIAISTGTPGPERKSTCGVLDQDGSLCGIVKIAESPAAKHQLRNEIKMLRTLADHAKLVPYVPALLAEQDLEGSLAAVQSVVNGDSMVHRFGHLQEAFLEKLNLERWGPFTSFDSYRVVEEGLSTLPDSVENLVQDALATSVALVDGRHLPVTISHGDFTPWNLRRNGTEVMAFDWEYGQFSGLPLQDELQYRCQVAFLLEGRSIADVSTTLSELRRIPHRVLDTPTVTAMHLMYFAQMLVKRIGMGYPMSDLQISWAKILLNDALNDTPEVLI